MGKTEERKKIRMAEKMTIFTIMRKFKSNSRLFPVLAIRAPELIKLSNMQYTLHTVLTALRNIISKDMLYDKNNTTIVIYDAELQYALQQPYNHVTEIRDIVAKQMEVVNPEQWEKLRVLTPAEDVTPKANLGRLAPASKFNHNKKFYVKTAFRKVLLRVKPDLKQRVFTYKELTNMLSMYILNNKKRLFHEANIKIANVENDLLGEVFGVKMFHRTQVHVLLRKQLTEVDEESSDSEDEVLEEAQEDASDSGIE